MLVRIGDGSTPCQEAVGTFVDLVDGVGVSGVVVPVLPFPPAPFVELGAFAGAGVLGVVLDSALRESVR